MKPLMPPPNLLVDPWAFRLTDPDGNLIGHHNGILVHDSLTGAVTDVVPWPGVERLVRAVPLDE